MASDRLPMGDSKGWVRVGLLKLLGNSTSDILTRREMA